MINKNEIYKNLFGQDTSMFDHIEDNNINEVYNNNLTLWYIKNSDIKQTTKDGKGIEIENHKILNLDNVILSKTKGGFELTEIDFIKDQLKKLSKLNSDALNIINEKKYTIYKSYLLEKQNQPQQVESIKTDEVKKELHNHIFKDNAFEVWQSMFDEFDVNESSRTDVKFMYEEMKKEELIHNTVNQKTFLEWITSFYDGLIVQKTSNHNRTPERLKAYSRAKNILKN